MLKPRSDGKIGVEIQLDHLPGHVEAAFKEIDTFVAVVYRDLAKQRGVSTHEMMLELLFHTEAMEGIKLRLGDLWWNSKGEVEDG